MPAPTGAHDAPALTLCQEPPIEGAAVEARRLERIDRQALRLAACQVQVNSPAAVAPLDHGQRLLERDVESRATYPFL